MLIENIANSRTAEKEALREALRHWKTTVEAELKGAPFEKKLVTRTAEGIALQPLYTRLDLEGLADCDSAPGAPPFRRGTRPFGYREKRWEVAQEIVAHSPEAFNAALLADLCCGQDSVVLAASEHGAPPFSNLAALRSALAGVDLAAVPVHVEAGADPLPVAPQVVALARDRNISPTQLRGSVTADPIAAWVSRGWLERELNPLLDSLAEWTQWARQHAPNLHVVGVNARLWGDAGANAVHELAFALATANEYLMALGARGITPDFAAPKFRFQFAVGPQFFTEIAKFRAWRPLWSRVLSAYGVDPQLAAAAAVHAATARWNQTRLDPHVNLLRVTTESLSAVLGGCDSLHIAPFDEAEGAASDFSRRIARNVHTLLAEEFGFAQTADPAGGAWYVEKLTDELGRKAWELFQPLQAHGGFVAALREGLPQTMVTEAVAEKADAVGKRRLHLIGTNLFPNLREPPRADNEAGPACPHPAPPHQARLPHGLANAPWLVRFEAIAQGANANADGEDPAGAAVAHPERHIAQVAPFRAGAGFEELRQASECLAARDGHRPRVFLARMGPAAQHRARADFASGFFAPGGFDVIGDDSFASAQAAAEAAVASRAPVTVLCSTDDSYPALVPAFAVAVKAACPATQIVVAGLPAEPQLAEAFRSAGVDEFIHVRANVHRTLARILAQIGGIA